MKRITSRHNALFKRIRAAIHEHDDEIVIEGPKAVADAQLHGWTPIATITRGEEFSEELFDALAETKSPQNVIGLFARPRVSAASILEQRDRIAVALDRVQDPGNVGTIVRLAAAFDASGVLLLPGCADAFGPKAIRASVGAVLTVPIADVSVDELRTARLYATAADGERIDPPTRDAVLVFGSEGAGVSTEIVAIAKKIAIPMSSRVESLNVATSAAILLARSYALRT